MGVEHSSRSQSTTGESNIDAGSTDDSVAPEWLQTVRANDEPANTAALDNLFALLSARRRRYALHALEQADEPLPLADLAQQIAAWETGSDLDSVDRTAKKRVYASLSSHHLDVLEDNNLVTVENGSAPTVAPTEALAEITVYTEPITGTDRPWAEYFLGLSLVLIPVVGAMIAGVGPLGAVPGVGTTIFVLTVYTVSALGYLYDQHQLRLGRPGVPPECRYQRRVSAESESPAAATADSARSSEQQET